MSQKPKRSTAQKRSLGGYSPFPIQLIALELNASKANTVLGFAASIQVNDILHQSGLITDDAWNNVKGTITALRTVDIIDKVTSSVTTLVEAATSGVEELEQARSAHMGANAKQLSGK